MFFSQFICICPKKAVTLHPVYVKDMTKRVIFLLAMLGVMAGEMAAVDTLYVRQTDTIVIRETRYKKVPVTVEKEVEKVVEGPRTGGAGYEDNVFFVYFPLGRYNLDDAAQIAVHEMAERLGEHPELGVRLTGFCDYVGGAELNDRLSVARATAVADRLKNAYGIDSRRIAVEGKGMLQNVKAEYGPNRRVEMRLESIGQLAKAEQPKQPKQPESTTLQQPAVKNEVPKAARANESANVKLLGTEVVTSDMTLSQLARKYYGNTFCWVYIYAMNKGVIKNPNALQIGQTIRIPELSDVDKQITKQESEEYYKMLRR